MPETAPSPPQRSYHGWAWLLVVAVLMGGSLAYSRYTSYIATATQAQSRLEMEARSIEAGVRRQLAAIDEALVALRGEFPLWRVIGMETGARSRIQELASSLPGVRQIVITDGRGVVLQASHPDAVGSLSAPLVSTGASQAAPSQSTLYIGAPVVGANGSVTTTLTRLERRADGTLAGAVTATLDAVVFDAMLAARREAADSRVALMIGNDTLLAVSGGKAQSPDDLRVTRQVEGLGSLIEPVPVLVVSRDHATVFANWTHLTSLIAMGYALVMVVCAMVLYATQRRKEQQDYATAKLQHAQAESAERLELALGGADLGLWDWHIPSGRTLYDERWCTMLGLRLDEVDPHVDTCLELIHPQDRLGMDAVLHKHLRGDTPLYENEHRVRHKDGRWVWIQDRGKVVERNAAGAPVRMIGTHHDISERREAEEASAESRALLRSLVETIPDQIWLKDVDGVYLDCNPAFERVNRLTREQIVGRTDMNLLSKEQAEVFMASDIEAMKGDKPVVYENTDPVGDGAAPRYFETIKTAMRDPQGRVVGLIGISRDITQRKRDQEEIRRLAFHDTLTTLPNRRLLEDRLRRALVASARNQHFGAIFFLDLDKFKILNDTLGHDVGDLLLKGVAQRLLASVRAQDTVARLGGDEFVVVLEDLSANEQEASTQARDVAMKIMAALNKPYQLAGIEYNSTPSLGVTMFRGTRVPVDELLKQADRAMYKAKGAGRNAARFYDSVMEP